MNKSNKLKKKLDQPQIQNAERVWDVRKSINECFENEDMLIYNDGFKGSGTPGDDKEGSIHAWEDIDDR